MKSFSLKKKDGSSAGIVKGTVQKKGFGGFSLKKKIIEKKPPLNVNNAFGESIITDTKREVAITSTEDVFEVAEDEEALIIVPKQNVNSWESRRKEALEKNEKHEQEDILKKSKELDKNKLNYGINHQQKIVKEENDVGHKSQLGTATVKKNLSEGAYQPTSESYQKIPVGKFGLAMLRGMGWTDDMEKTKKKKRDSEIIERKPVGGRPALLGLGAKPLISGPSRISDHYYVPVVRVQRKDQNDKNKAKVEREDT